MKIFSSGFSIGRTSSSSWWRFPRWILVTVILIISPLIWCEAEAGPEAKKSRTRDLPVHGARGIIFENPLGMISVAGESRDNIRLEMQCRLRGRSVAYIGEVLKHITYEQIRDGDRLHFRPLYKGREIRHFRKSDLRGLKLKMDIKVRIPRNLELVVGATKWDLFVQGMENDVQLNSTSGEIRAREISGDLEINLTSGDVQVMDLDGDLQVVLTSGDLELIEISGDVVINGDSGLIDIEDVGGDLIVNSRFGDVLISRIGGDIRASTTAADIEIVLPRGNVQINTSNGDISIMGCGRPDQNLILSSSSGDVEITLIEKVSCRVDLTTTMGAIHCRFPMIVLEISRQHLVGMIGSGKDLLRVVTASGDVRILPMED